MVTTELFLIDAHALCYRSFYAIKGLANSQGQKTNAVFGFVNTLRKLLREYRPLYMAVCFDSPAKTHRQKKFADYKIQRPSMPDDLISQIPIIKEIVGCYRVPSLEFEGYEADDIIASITRKFASPQLKVIIVSDDKDMFQLVGHNVRVLSLRKDKLIDPEGVREIMGLAPDYMTDFIALAGDSVDNIPGVKGIGEVSARQLISRYGPIEEIFRHLDDIQPVSIKNRLASQREEAFLSKELAVLNEDIPLDFCVEDMKVTAPDHEMLIKIFSDLEFKRLVFELMEQHPSKAVTNIQKIQAEEELKDVLAAIETAGEFSFLFDENVEADIWLAGTLVVTCQENPVWQIPQEFIPGMKDVFGQKDIRKNTYDYKHALKHLDRFGLTLKGEVFDVKLAAYLLSPARTAAQIFDLGWQYLKIPPQNTQEASGQIRIVHRLSECLRTELRTFDLLSLCSEVEIPLSMVLWAMEREGVSIDVGLLKNLSKECEAKITQLHAELFELAGEEFNLNSPKQLSRVLFDKLNLPVIKRTKTGFSTNEEVLTRLASLHPLPALILDYRQLAKLKSTYIDALPKLVDPQTQRIHATFNQTGTETGRLSSYNPNLQNIPIRTEMGRRIRKAFVPSAQDRIIISADYSQIELRILAHLSKDENLLFAFQKDEDIHTFTAAQVFDVPEKDVTQEMRISAKRVNFGIIYGMSAFGLAKDLNISQGEAAEFIDRYFLRYPRVKDFMDAQIKECEANGYVTTLLHRRRYIPDIQSSSLSIRQFAQRQAINTPVQGTAADLIKLAMIRIYEAINKNDLRSKMIITVHDELVFDALQDEKDRLISLIKDHMEHTLTLDVPIKVSIKTGKNWLETKKVNEAEIPLKS